MEKNLLRTVRSFISKLKLAQQEGAELEGAQFVPTALNTDKNQSLIVGSEIVSFVKGVTPGQRQDVLNSSLLAQLAAKNAITDPEDVHRWYDYYFDVLSNIGWTIQERSFERHVSTGNGFEAHQAIEKLATTLLGPQAAALTVVKSALDSVRDMDRDSPWITHFERESKNTRAARFQVTLAERSQNEQFLVSLMAFIITAQSQLTQILFFKFNSSDAELKHSSGKVTINEDILSHVRDNIKVKLANHTRDYIRALPEL